MKTNAHVDMKMRNNPEYVTVAEFLAIGDAIKAATDWQLGPDVERIRVMVLHHASHAKSHAYWLCDYAKEKSLDQENKEATVNQLNEQDRNIQAMLSNLRTDIAEIVSETAIIQKDAVVGELMAKVDEVVLSAQTGKPPESEPVQ